MELNQRIQRLDEPLGKTLHYPLISIKGETMGGSGSTRWRSNKKRVVVEDCKVLTLSGLLSGPSQGVITWRRFDQVTGRVNYRIERNQDYEPILLKLSYILTSTDEEMHCGISLGQTRLAWGRYRYWLLCPIVNNGMPCGKRVTKLYLPPRGKFFGCRDCHNLSYRSRQEYQSKQFWLSILPPSFVADCKDLSLSELIKMIQCNISGRMYPPRLQKKISQSSHKKFEKILAAIPDPYASFLTVNDLQELSGLSSDQIELLIHARLLVSDRQGKFRPKLVSWAKKLAYLLDEGWMIDEIKQWSKERWSLADPKQWPPDHTQWKFNQRSGEQ
jgi:hypothetical protein